MLVLHTSTQILCENGAPVRLRLGKGFSLPNGDFVGGATPGWTNGEWTLTEVDPTPSIAPGYRRTACSLDLVDGMPVWVETLEPIPEADLRASWVTAVKTEAKRRILAFLSEDKQRNLNARMTVLSQIGAANWTEAEADEWAAAAAAWAQVEAIRASSNIAELLDPIPDDVTAAGLWP